MRQPFEGDNDTNEPTMFRYHVAQLLSWLDKRTDVSVDTMIALEWA